jgi:hypothetical protein
MNIELLGELRQCPIALDGGERAHRQAELHLASCTEFRRHPL